MIFESNGMLKPGFHEYNIIEFKNIFVDGFETSQRRASIFSALMEFLDCIFSFGTPDDIWIDGSYATNKVNPNDADIVLFLDYQHHSAINGKLSEFRAKYETVLDIYLAFAISNNNKIAFSPRDFGEITNMRNYWKGQFGFDRSDTPKGIVRISCESISEYIKGGTVNVAN